MPKIPERLQYLHQAEEELHERTIELVTANEDLTDHLDIMERAMNVLDVLRKQNASGDEDERTVALLGIRVFNSFATAWKLTASGYYQAGTMILRDVLETTNLVNAFLADPALIEQWRKADRKSLLNDFGPATIRRLLDDRQGQGKSRRGEIYAMFCSLGTHPTAEGFALLRPRGLDAHIGPFVDITALRAVLEEVGKLAAQAGSTFCVSFDGSQDGTDAASHRFMLGAMDYFGKYIGNPFSPERRAEIERLFGEK